MIRRLPVLLVPLIVAACGTPGTRPGVERAETAPPATAKPSPQKQPAWVLKKGGGYYQDDGPGDNPPADLDAIPDAVPKAEPPHRFANNPYSVLGRDYVPLKPGTPYHASGIASWYGRKFNGQKTSSGEIYDMYGMTAAHATLPIPSYARVTNPANGKSVIVRINDRGPFHAGRLIDLSYTAAWKLGYIGNGSTLVEVESIQPGQETLVAQARPAPPPQDDADPIARFAEAMEPPAKPLPEVADARGHYLQLGAFGNRDNAEALKARLARELGDLGDKLVVQASGKLYRLQLGPWGDAREARAVAQRIREALDYAPVLVQR
ncbi:MAG TPA: septal ring lytic transglycosylase RlpA family protein [Rhodocyclaceae bacterium]